LPHRHPWIFRLFPLVLAACSGGDPEAPLETLPGAGGAAGNQASPTAGAAGEGAAGNPTAQEPGPFAAEVVSFTPGPGAGFGQENLPDVVLGPPEGGGDGQGSLDVVSLGAGGQIVLRLGIDAVDGPGPDLIVFENPFRHGAQKEKVWAEPGEVSVSEDGETWATFPCAPAQLEGSRCAGVRPVFASTSSGISPLDPEAAGGDPFDLAEVGVTRVRYVKIRDLSTILAPPTAGFDLDAIAVIHAAP
jgi:hypothetical protein